MKKNLKKILLIIVSTFAILFIIQTVDWMINGKEYQEIKIFLKEQNKITLKYPECSSNNFKIIDSFEGNSTTEPSKSKLKSIITQCDMMIAEIDALKIPDIKNNYKKLKMQEFKHILKISGDSSVQYLKILYDCNDTKDNCEEKLRSNVNEALMASKETLFAVPTYFEIKKTYSIRDILINRPIMFFLNIYINYTANKV